MPDIKRSVFMFAVFFVVLWFGLNKFETGVENRLRIDEPSKKTPSVSGDLNQMEGTVRKITETILAEKEIKSTSGVTWSSPFAEPVRKTKKDRPVKLPGRDFPYRLSGIMISPDSKDRGAAFLDDGRESFLIRINETMKGVTLKKISSMDAFFMFEGEQYHLTMRPKIIEVNE